jgi:hypothetical protein
MNIRINKFPDICINIRTNENSEKAMAASFLGSVCTNKCHFFQATVQMKRADESEALTTS